MADPFDMALDQGFSRLESGSNNFDLQVGEDGLTTYVAQQESMLMGVAETEGPQQFAGAEDQENPFAIAGEVEPTSVGEFLQQTGQVGTGALGGAAAVTAGLLGDIVGLAEGLWGAMNADEGKKFEAFLNKLSRRSQTMGSEKFISEYENFINSLDIDDDAKKSVLAGSQYLGEWAELPGGVAAASAILKGAKKASKAVGATGALVSPMTDEDPSAEKNLNEAAQ